MSHLLLVEVGFLQCHEKMKFLRLTQENEWHLFALIKPLSFQSLLSSVHHGRSVAVSLAELGLKPLPRVSVPHLHSPLQHQAGLTCVPAAVHQSIAYVVHMAQDHAASRNTGKCRETGPKPEQQERESLWGF